MSSDRIIIATTLDWQGITLEITYEPDWLNMGERYPNGGHAHLEVRSPERTPLPITETGYRSHFLNAEEVDQAGGPAAYVEAWLNYMAQSREWQDYRDSSRQLSLF